MPAGPRLPLPAFTDQLCFYYRVDFNNLPPLAATITPQVPRDSHKHPLCIHQNPNSPNGAQSRHFVRQVLRVTPLVRHLYLTSSHPEQGATPPILAGSASKVSSIVIMNSDTVAHQLFTLRLDIGALAEQDASAFLPTLRAIRELELIGCRQHVVDAVVNNGLRHLIKVVCVGVGATFGSTLGFFNDSRITLTGLHGFADNYKKLARLQLQCCPYIGSDGISALIKASPEPALVILGHSYMNDSILMDLALSLGRASRLRSLSEPMNSDDKVFYEADDGDSLAPDVEDSEKPDYKETYEPEDENSPGSEDETEDEDNSKATRGDITSSE
ncbi:hypothetical protein BKA57DRAFT_538311 [Linnemannia elongata]|nr:hypothetical protein BKA57DRAFT_538311 [Linnemannia elongata]